MIGRSRNLTAAERMGIYANAYYARLLECLASFFPVLQKALGADVFESFAFEYLQHYPSKSYTLDRLGESFARFLEETRPEPEEGEEAGSGGVAGLPDRPHRLRVEPQPGLRRPRRRGEAAADGRAPAVVPGRALRRGAAGAGALPAAARLPVPGQRLLHRGAERWRRRGAADPRPWARIHRAHPPRFRGAALPARRPRSTPCWRRSSPAPPWARRSPPPPRSAASTTRPSAPSFRPGSGSGWRKASFSRSNEAGEGAGSGTIPAWLR